MLLDLDRIELVELAAKFDRNEQSAQDSGDARRAAVSRLHAALLRRVIAELWPPVVAGKETAAEQFRSTVKPPAANSSRSSTRDGD